ncbi:unnamed protein product [Fusarium graminearum]|uniref:Chromosome 2, complete genome n=1 Tax=Gibberella zeae (strain ATCC MYA-4620 / CBS 123657 / FGSC 9075 / NRRL 31084 / PH-1) TaxID=229533 RepID=A0A098DEJ5_GIBZE|nr:unnamed protein product [Fusarium graminearum]CZS80689.1 unnamed protein product [Fusarium graminearum]
MSLCPCFACQVDMSAVIDDMGLLLSTQASDCKASGRAKKPTENHDKFSNSWNGH